MENTSTTTATVFGMNCMELLSAVFGHPEKKKSTPLVSGAESTGST
ncbi:MAG: hypothetical protein ACLTBV_19500 [Enterocloster bolteae]